MLTALSTESCATKVEIERETVPSAEPLDAVRLTGMVGSSKGAKQEEKEGKRREKRGSHERELE